MSGPVDKRLKLDQPPGIYLKSTDTRPIKATKLAPDTIRANEIVIESFKTGKVTAVVAILKVFGDNTRNSRNANPGKLLNKPNKRLNSKKKHLNRALKRPNELNESASDTSERLIVKQKTIRVLLDTGSSGDLLFVRKGSQKYIPTLKISYVENRTNLSKEYLGHKRVAGILKRISYEIHMSYVCK